MLTKDKDLSEYHTICLSNVDQCFQLNEKFIQKERICSVLCFNICNCQHYVDIYRWIREGRRSISYGHDGYDDGGAAI